MGFIWNACYLTLGVGSVYGLWYMLVSFAGLGLFVLFVLIVCCLRVGFTVADWLRWFRCLASMLFVCGRVGGFAV